MKVRAEFLYAPWVAWIIRSHKMIVCVCVFDCCWLFCSSSAVESFFSLLKLCHSLRRFGSTWCATTLDTQLRLNAMPYKIQYKIQNNGMERNGIYPGFSGLQLLSIEQHSPQHVNTIN